MKRFIAAVPAALLASVLAAPVMAQVTTGVPNTQYGQHHEYAERFNNYLDSHPQEAQQLKQNPHLIDNPAYMKSHPDLAAYFKNHPGVREEIRSNPHAFMHRENRYNESKTRWDNRHQHVSGEQPSANQQHWNRQQRRQHWQQTHE